MPALIFSVGNKGHYYFLFFQMISGELHYDRCGAPHLFRLIRCGLTRSGQDILTSVYSDITISYITGR